MVGRSLRMYLQCIKLTATLTHSELTMDLMVDTLLLCKPFVLFFLSSLSSPPLGRSNNHNTNKCKTHVRRQA